MRRRGELASLARGSYIGPSDLPADPRERHLLQILASADRLRVDAVVSHQSAAVLHGLDLWSTPLGQVHITRVLPAYGHRSNELHCHVAALASAEIVFGQDLLVTSPARTVLDLARSLPFEQAVVVADSALHLGLTTIDELHAALASAASRRGVRAAARVVAFADGRSESVGESRSRVLIAQAGLPAPETQFEVRDQNGRLIARCDFGWSGRRLVGEFDGRSKYGRLLRPGQRPEDVVHAEKLREDDIRGEDLGVVRWTWAELTATVLGAKIRRAFLISDRRSTYRVDLPQSE